MELSASIFFAIQDEGLLRSVGVSNFGVGHLEALREHGRPAPTVNQFEMHPLIYQKRYDLLDYCKQHRVLVQAYGSIFFGKPERLAEAPVADEQQRADVMEHCPHCRVSEAEREAEDTRHCFGIWLHALTYDGPGWSFRAPPPPWAA